MGRIRQILLTQYIGSILIALLACQAVVTLITSVIQNVSWYVNDQRTHSVLGAPYTSFPWERVIFSVVNIGLFVVAAHFLAAWLHPAPPAASPVVLDDDTKPESLDRTEHR